MEFKENDIIWEECVTANGKKYEVGYLPTDAEDKSLTNKDKSINGKQDFGAVCNWEVSSSLVWKTPAADFISKTGIAAYSVNLNESSSIYSNIINFQNQEHYDYHFFDETGDSYRCNTFLNGEHYVRYNSSAPTIVFVTGS